MGAWACVREREAIPVPSGTLPACLEASEKRPYLHMVRKKVGARSGSSLPPCTHSEIDSAPANLHPCLCLCRDLSVVLCLARLDFALRRLSLGLTFRFASFLSPALCGSFSRSQKIRIPWSASPPSSVDACPRQLIPRERRPRTY